MNVPCINLCEIDWRGRSAGAVGAACCAATDGDPLTALVSRACLEAGFAGCERLYVGSSFCATAFLNACDEGALEALERFWRAWGVPVTLTVPLPSQGELAAVKERVVQVVGRWQCVDEVTVNDYGMLQWAASQLDVPVNLGRLFFRDTRDVRYEAGFPRQYRPAFLPEGYEALAQEFGCLAGVELDPAGLAVDVAAAPVGATVAVHVPYLFATTGAYCAFAQDGRGLPHRAGAGCARECRDRMVTYRLEAADGEAPGRPLFFTRHGKTVYVLNDGVAVEGEGCRIVWTPRHFGWLAEEAA